MRIKVLALICGVLLGLGAQPLTIGAALADTICICMPGNVTQGIIAGNINLVRLRAFPGNLRDCSISER